MHVMGSSIQNIFVTNHLTHPQLSCSSIRSYFLLLQVQIPPTPHLLLLLLVQRATRVDHPGAGNIFCLSTTFWP